MGILRFISTVITTTYYAFVVGEKLARMAEARRRHAFIRKMEAHLANESEQDANAENAESPRWQKEKQDG